MKCRHCQQQLEQVFIDLGHSPPSNSYLSKEALKREEVYYPLKVFVCGSCFLVQVDEYKKATEIFDSEYAYFSSVSKSWLEHSKAYTDQMVGEFGFNDSSLVVEIASNDGYLLQYFKEKNIAVLGIEPTASTAKVAREKGITTVERFFGVELANELVNGGQRADLLLGNNVLAHVPDINDFVKGLKIVLKEDGVVTMEFPHLLQLVANNQFDTIYHEHFSYLSLITVQKIFRDAGLDIFHVEELPTHGGSLRIFAKHLGNTKLKSRSSVSELIAKEQKAGINDLTYYQNFESKVKNIKHEFIEFLINAKRNGKSVAAYGAAAKGNTLLNYCGIKNDLIDFVVDRAFSKQGKFLPGSHIPVVTEDKLKSIKPDYIVIFPWNIREEICKQLSYVKEWNGKFVITIPKLEIWQ